MLNQQNFSDVAAEWKGIRDGLTTNYTHPLWLEVNDNIRLCHSIDQAMKILFLRTVETPGSCARRTSRN